MKNIVLNELYKRLEEAKEIASLYPDKAIEMSEEIIRIASSEDLKLELAYSYLNIAFASRIKSDTSSMLDNSYKALSIFKSKNDSIGQAQSLNLIGVSYFYSSMYDEALKSFLNAKKPLEIHKDESILTSILNNIGEIYKETEIYDKAIEYYNLASEIALRDNNVLNHAVILGNIAEIKYLQKNFDTALNIYNKSYNILLKTN